MTIRTDQHGFSHASVMPDDYIWVTGVPERAGAVVCAETDTGARLCDVFYCHETMQWFYGAYERRIEVVRWLKKTV